LGLPAANAGRFGRKKGTDMSTQLLKAVLIAALSCGAVGALVGCERDDAKKAGDAVEKAAGKAGDAANRGINYANDAARDAVEQGKEATDAARDAVGRAADRSGEAAQQAGHATKEWIAPTTAPAAEPGTGK